MTIPDDDRDENMMNLGENLEDKFRLIEQCLTSHQTHHRSYRGRFYRLCDQTNSVKALKETSWSFR